MNLDQQIALHYEELKRLAHRMLMRRDATLQTTGLVHELLLKLRSHASVESAAHLMNLAARAMRQILVDAARRRACEKRGGDQLNVTASLRLCVDPLILPIDLYRRGYGTYPRHPSQRTARWYHAVAEDQACDQGGDQRDHGERRVQSKKYVLLEHKGQTSETDRSGH